MTDTDTIEFTDRLRRDGVIRSAEARLVPLPGGVSSEIYQIHDGDRVFVVKRALPKLKVAADWFADTSRNTYEQAYLRYVDQIIPGAVPQIIHADPESGYFAMEFLDGFVNWKQEMLAGVFSKEIAMQAGQTLGVIHATSWGDPVVARDFDVIENFDQLRIDPYIRVSAYKHPEIATMLLEEAQRLRLSRQCLMHGDYSPKNMLHRDARLVVLDCEVACHGDAAFDLAFLLNHLMLKALVHAPRSPVLPDLFEQCCLAYADALGPRAPEVLDATVRLLPMLMLARVDGKSPVEYLDEPQQQHVRAFAIEQIKRRSTDLSTLARHWYLQP